MLTDDSGDAVEAGWLGAKARSVYGAAGIGTAYSPPSPLPTHDPLPTTLIKTTQPSVETIIDIGYRPDVSLFLPALARAHLIVLYQGWVFRCEKGGVRRVLMNLLGNSLKVSVMRLIRSFLCLSRFPLLVHRGTELTN